MKKIFVAIGLILLLQNTWAIDLRDAKSQSLVGEANTGYLAAVHAPVSAEVRALIVDVNRKREARFSATASKTGATVPQVAYRFYELAVQRTLPGNYYQDTDGNWIRK